jgi:DNA-binding response OmpR family regulator
MEYKILLVETRQSVLDQFNEIEWGDEFSIETCSSGQEAFSFLDEQFVHIIYISNKLSDMDAGQFINRKQQNLKIELIPIIVLSEEPDYKVRIEQMVEGADDYILLPFDSQELKTKARIMLREAFNISSYSQKTAKGFSGNLNEMNLLDLLQTLELGRKSGVIHLERSDDEAFVYVRDGMVFDAEQNSKYGEETFFHLFTWTEGRFQVEFKPMDRERKIQLSSQELTVRGMKILEDWLTIRSEFQTLEMVPQFQRDVQISKLKEDWQKIIPLIDGSNSLRQILEKSPIAETETLTIIRDLQLQDYIQESLLDLEEELLIFGDTDSNGKYQIDSDKLKKTIHSFIETLVRKRQSKENLKFEDQNSTREKHKPKVLFDKVELQYMKRKLL